MQEGFPSCNTRPKHAQISCGFVSGRTTLASLALVCSKSPLLRYCQIQACDMKRESISSVGKCCKTESLPASLPEYSQAVLPLNPETRMIQFYQTDGKSQSHAVIILFSSYL